MRVTRIVPTPTPLQGWSCGSTDSNMHGNRKIQRFPGSDSKIRFHIRFQNSIIGTDRLPTYNTCPLASQTSIALRAAYPDIIFFFFFKVTHFGTV